VTDFSRRTFVKGAVALGACSVLPGHNLFAQAAATSSARLIDVHQHYVSPEYFAVMTRLNGVSPVQGYGLWSQYTPARAIEAMDQAGVATTILSQFSRAVGVRFANDEETRRAVRDLNEYAAARMVGAYKGRFGQFAVLPMPDVDGSLREIAYAIDTLKTDGVALLTSYDDKWLGDPAFDAVFAELDRRKAVVFVHPIDAACCRPVINGITPQTLEYPTDTTRAIMNLIVSNTATRCPDVRFIFSHAGGTLVSIAGRFLGDAVSAQGLARPAEPNSRLAHVRRFYYDTAGSTNPVQMQSLRLLVPDSQIVFGTDYPFANGPAAHVAGLQDSGFTAQTLRGIYRDNALRLLPKYA
jgi:predicted TIM-barrel fold metal-dependent hydrolase